MPLRAAQGQTEDTVLRREEPAGLIRRSPLTLIGIIDIYNQPGHKPNINYSLRMWFLLYQLKKLHFEKYVGFQLIVVFTLTIYILYMSLLLTSFKLLAPKINSILFENWFVSAIKHEQGSVESDLVGQWLLPAIHHCITLLGKVMPDDLNSYFKLNWIYFCPFDLIVDQMVSVHIVKTD